MSDGLSSAGYSYSQDSDAGWVGKFPVFYCANPEELLMALRGFVREPSPQQLSAWEHSVPSLQGQVGKVLEKNSQSKEFSALLEYVVLMQSFF